MKTPFPNDLSLVILCYQAGFQTRQFVCNAIEEFKRCAITNFELILVGNFHPGKQDDTPQSIQFLANKHHFIKFVAKPKEGMMGWDMRSGLGLAEGKFVAVIDGDGQMPIHDVVRVYNTIRDSNFDMVKTFRTTRGDGLKRRILSKVYNFVFNLLFPGIKSSDVNSKPKILRNESLKKLSLCSSDWFIDAEIMIQAHKHKLKIKEIPTDFFKLEDRASYVRTSAIIEFIKNLIVYKLKL